MTTIHGQTFLPAKLPGDVIKRMVPIALKLKKDSYRKILQGKIFFKLSNKAVFRDFKLAIFFRQ